MKRFLLIALGFSLVLTACRLGQMGEATVTASSESTAPSLPAPVPTATITPLSPTETRIPPTATPLPFLITGLYKIQMFADQTGWAWATRPDHKSDLLRTEDGGQTWRNVMPAELPNPSPAFFLDSQTAWLQTYDDATYEIGLGFTNNGGKDWVAINQSFPFVPALFHFYNKMDGWAERDDVGAGQAAIGFYETHDGGVSWNQVMLTDPSQDDGSGLLHLCNICADTIYYEPTRLIIIKGDAANQPVGSVRLYFSANLGKTWKKLVLPLPSAKYKNDGLVNPGAPIFFDLKTGVLPFVVFNLNSAVSNAYSVLSIYSTQDGGMTWTPNSTVVENVTRVDRLDFVSPNDAFVACGKNLCVTHDGAKTWQTLESNLNFSWTDSTESVSQFDFISATTGWAITTDGKVYDFWKTIDGGGSWSKLSPSLLP